MASRRRRALTSAGGVLLALAAGACAGFPHLRPLRSFGTIEPDQEREIGARFDAELRAKLPFVEDPLVLELMNDLGQSIVDRLGPQPFVYRFRVIRDPSLNAFAVPGGYVYLHSGTIRAAGDPAELAGVLAHEIAHVKARHFARLQKRSALPDLIAGVAAIAAAAATGQPGLAVAAQAANVAVKLRFTREFEAEADRLGATFMSRAGYSPEGMVRFLERILVAQRTSRSGIPPYLYTHPAVSERIETVQRLARELKPRSPPRSDLAARLRAVQLRLAKLVAAGRSVWDVAASFDRTPGDRALARANARVEEGDLAGAIQTLERAEAQAPADPRLPFRRAQLLRRAGRPSEAIEAYRRTLHLDPRALVFEELGLLYASLGEPARAVFYLEQAAWRSAPGGRVHAQAVHAIERLTFPVLLEAGLGRTAAEPVSAASHARFRSSEPSAVWWARIGRRYLGQLGKLSVRWIAPDGTVALSEHPRPARGGIAVSVLPLAGSARPLGFWWVEVRFEERLVDRRSFELVR